MKSGRLLFCLSCTFTLGVLAQNKDSIRIAIDNYEYEKVFLNLLRVPTLLTRNVRNSGYRPVRNSTNGKPHFRYS